MCPSTNQTKDEHLKNLWAGIEEDTLTAKEAILTAGMDLDNLNPRGSWSQTLNSAPFLITINTPDQKTPREFDEGHQ